MPVPGPNLEEGGEAERRSSTELFPLLPLSTKNHKYKTLLLAVGKTISTFPVYIKPKLVGWGEIFQAENSVRVI